VEPHAGDGDCASAPAATPAATRRPMVAAPTTSRMHRSRPRHRPTATPATARASRPGRRPRFTRAVSVGAQCASCHTGAFPPAVGKPGDAIHAGVTGNCESCHKSTSTGRRPRSTTAASTRRPTARSCHNGSAATGKSGTHIPVGASNCFSCHNTTGWTPSKWNHTQVTVTAQVRQLPHGGYPPADREAPTTSRMQSVAATASANCDTCHKRGLHGLGAGQASTARSASSRAQCASCHSGAFPPAVGKPGTAIHANVTGNCESCHKSTSSWSSAKVDHSGFNGSTNCAQLPQRQCRDRQVGTAHPGGGEQLLQLPCHHGLDADEVEPHAGDGDCEQCASCHTGGYPPADGSANHIPYQSVAATASANCDTCHRAGSRPGRRPSSTVRSASVRSASCHSGAFPPAVGKPNTAIHANVTGNCESCHKSTSQLVAAKVDHSGFNAATNCAQLPQRQCCDRQVGHAHPGGGEQLLQLPCHHRLDADEVEPHAGDGDCAMRQLPHRRLPAGRRSQRQPRPVCGGGGHGIGQLRHLSPRGLHGLGAGQVAQCGQHRCAVRRAATAAPSRLRWASRRRRSMPT
jgi:hypothetical protein